MCVSGTSKRGVGGCWGVSGRWKELRGRTTASESATEPPRRSAGLKKNEQRKSLCEEFMIASGDREETAVQGDTKEEKVKEARQERSDFAEMLETQTVWKAVGFQKRSRVGYSMQKFARPVGIQWRSGGIQADLNERVVGRLKSQPRPVALRSIFFLARNMLWRRVEGRIGGQQVDKLVLGRP
jgi:hypothetical protein